VDRAESEIDLLRRCTRDVVAVSTLPAVWLSHTPQQVAASLLEVLYDVLRLDFAFVRLNDGLELLYARDGFLVERDVRTFSTALDRWLATPAAADRRPLPIVDAEALHVATAPVGSGQPQGLLVLGSRRAGFPLQTERLVWNVAANQAAVVLQQKRDQAALRELHEAERKAREEAQQAVRFSDLFIGILGHDLRNPLSAISSAAELLIRREEAERITAPMSRVLSSAQRMSRMIDQLLDFTLLRIGGGVPLRPAEVDLSALVGDLVEELRVGMPDARVSLDVVGDLVVVWDRDRMAQVISNLLANALQHGTPGCPVSIVLDGSAADHVVVRVQNAGVVDPALLPVLFEPFRGAKRTNQRGLGLGLFITHQLVLGHGGVVRATSNEADGTCFELRLPRRARTQ
jgi:signal transduction histidine kinase